MLVSGINITGVSLRDLVEGDGVGVARTCEDSLVLREGDFIPWMHQHLIGGWKGLKRLRGWKGGRTERVRGWEGLERVMCNGIVCF